MNSRTFCTSRTPSSISASLLLLSMLSTAHAETVCVDNSAHLQAALGNGETQTAPYTIKLVQAGGIDNHYLLPAMQLAFSQPIRIEGGYSATCASREINATNTVIDFGGANNDVAFSQSGANASASITLDGLTLQHGRSLSLSAGDWDQFGDTPGSLHLSHLRITDFDLGEAMTNAPKTALVLQSHRAAIMLENVQIDHLHQADSAAPCSIRLGLDGDSRATVRHASIDLSNAENLCLAAGQASGNYRVDIDDSIVWSSDESAAGIASVDDYHVSQRFELNLSNTIHRDNISGVAGLRVNNSTSVDPQWMLPSDGNYHLRPDSPALNAGTRHVWQGKPDTDVEGNTTVAGAASDLGAQESPFKTLQAFTVTNTADNAPNDPTTLRGAITAANLLAGPSTINFNVANSGSATDCVIPFALNTVLPAITAPITINGNTQSGSLPNTDTDAFNARICVRIFSIPVSLPTGFKVASGSTNATLTLRGVGLGGFDQPVTLQGGKNHLIAGNQFGGFIEGQYLAPASLNAITIGTVATGTFVVGGVATADRNVIVGALSGINISSTFITTPAQCQLVNNLIGLHPDGVTKVLNNVMAANDFGINLAGGGCLVKGNRIANNTIYGLWINGSDNNVIQSNKIGIDAAANNAPNGSAILVNGSNNAIGTTASGAVNGASLGNLVRYGGSVGVLINGGTGNTVRSNQIFALGAITTTVDIDLDTSGATPNDLDDTDTGVNELQNFPLVKTLIFASVPASGATNIPVTLSGKLNSQPGQFRIDAYFANSCNSIKRGRAQVFFDNTSANIVSGNTVVFNMSLVLPNVAANAAVSLVATDASGNTSEIGTCFPVDRIYQDGVEGD